MSWISPTFSPPYVFLSRQNGEEALVVIVPALIAVSYVGERPGNGTRQAPQVHDMVGAHLNLSHRFSQRDIAISVRLFGLLRTVSI